MGDSLSHLDDLLANGKQTIFQHKEIKFCHFLATSEMNELRHDHKTL